MGDDVSSLGDLWAKIQGLFEDTNSRIDSCKSDLEIRITSVEAKLLELKTDCSVSVKQVSERLNETRNDLYAVSNQLDRLERAHDLILNGVPFSQNEDLQVLFRMIAAKLAYNPANTPIVSLKRLSKQAITVGTSPPILCQFAIRNERIELYGRYLRSRNLTLRDVGFETIPARPTKEEAGTAATAESSSAAVTETRPTNTSSAATVGKVLLATAVLLLVDDAGQEFPARALLDSGSECNIVSTKLAQRMHVSRNKANVQISGVGQVPTKTSQKVRATVKSRLSKYCEVMEFYVLAKVTEDLPTSPVEPTSWTVPEGVQLADPEFFRTNPIDVLLGGEFFFNFFPSKQRISLGAGLPSLVESVFGWIVTGRCGWNRGEAPIVCQHSTVTETLEEIMTKFWECEDGGLTSDYSVEESTCEDHHVRTVKRGGDGRYTVGMPKSADLHIKLGESKSAADRRLLFLERRLARDDDLKKEYHAFMKDYLDRNHMCKIIEDPTSTATTYYLPHHPVIRSSSTTTRVRVVFDALNKTSTGTSLNDVLLNGPVIQDDLRTIISRSRLFPILLVADVEKMFRQIRMDAEDLPLQRIRWRFSEDDPIDTYELLTVTYGTKPAPFLATRTLKQLSVDDATKYPLAAERIARDVYMDDVITGAYHPAEAKQIREQLDTMTLGAGFPLRKWVSNCEEALEGVSEDNLALPKEKGIDFDEERTVKTLGLVWEPKTDTFRFKIESALIPPNELTKAKILSIIAKIFDPLGLVGPVVAKAKIFMQGIWELKNAKGKPWDWNDPLPKSMLDEWMQFYEQLHYLNNLRIPRFAMIPNPVHIQLHFCSDASEKALGANLYIRSEDKEGRVKVSFFTSKSRVAPLKRQPIPRLELNGFWLAADMYRKFKECTTFRFETFFWTDSRTVLQWLAKPPRTWNPYVANRVSFIQHITQGCHLFHVPGVMNPADQLSRGLDPKEFIDGDWDPLWMYETSSWPAQATPEEETEDCAKERRKHVESAAAVSAKSFNESYFGKFNEYWKLIRTTACWRRYLRNRRLPEAERTLSVPLTTKELREAEWCLARLVQQEAFGRELQDLAKGKPVHNTSKLRWFNPQLSKEGVIRVGGRLGNSDRNENFKHPIIIPGNHHFSKLLADCLHLRLFHAGTQLMLATMRQKFWPLRGRDLCRQTTHQCKDCFKA
ncbi:uncharacterized protein LOC120426371 [Culex pipiens pallens]|uniref:uncharacterized protein LOC120426371 n=1 Tax=Culex pipiens pallens TaxID=42434 RepID=UPI0022AA3500|nr:uncharacterized protein LOC120426371 [Culex pipiens pallens]